jgi:hypothetical protein
LRVAGGGGGGVRRAFRGFAPLVPPRAYSVGVSLIGILLLVAAAALIVAAEWPRLGQRAGLDESARRERKRRKSHLRVVETETDDFARSVERDLANLPTIDPRERKKN